MAATSEELLVRISGTTELLRQELRRGDDALGGFQNNVKTKLGNVDREFGNLNKSVTAGIANFNSLRNVLGAFGLALGVSEMISFGRGVLKLADDIEDTAGQLQISTDLLQGMRFAAEETGVEAGALETAIARLNAKVGDAVSGQKAAIDSFKRLGIEFDDADGKARSTEDTLRDLADLIKSLPSPAERAAAAAELLGDRAGPRLVALLAGGTEALASWQERAEKAGQVWGPETVARLAEAERAIERFKNAATIKAGEVLSFLFERADLEEQFNLIKQLDRVVGQIGDLQERINQTRAASGDGFMDALDAADLADFEAQMRELVAFRNEIISKMPQPQGHAGSGITFQPPAAPGTLPAPIDTSAADKLARALEDIQLKLRVLNAEAEDDAFGKLLAQNFDKAGLSLDDFSGKAEELRILTQQQFQLEQDAEIGKLALAAAQDADREAVAKYNEVLREGQALTESVRTAEEQYQATLDRAIFLRDQQIISQETFNRVVDQAGDAFVQADADAQMLIQSAGDVGRGFVSAFGKIGTSINSVSDFLHELLGLLAQVAANLAGGGIESLLGDIIKAGLNSSSSVGGAVDSMIAANPELFAGGGIMTSRGRLPLRRYGGGGIAHTPQLAMFAEGGVPEAYVPVPNGRIPVELRGAAGGPTVNVNVTNNISGGSAEQNTDAARRVGNSIQRAMRDFVGEEILFQQRSGGMLNQHVVG